MAKSYNKELSLQELATLPDDEIDTSDIPELDETFWNENRIVLPESTEQDIEMAGDDTIRLTENQLALIKRLVGSGLYEGSDDVISAGLKLLEHRDRQGADFIAALETDILVGLESGPAASMESSKDLLKMFRQQRL
jgi:antitoxin ParD1/3/4